MNSLIRNFLTLGFISAVSVLSAAQVNWLGTQNNDFESMASSDLTSGSTLATNPGSVGQSVTVSDTMIMTVPSRRFMRLRVTHP